MVKLLVPCVNIKKKVPIAISKKTLVFHLTGCFFLIQKFITIEIDKLLSHIWYTFFMQPFTSVVLHFQNKRVKNFEYQISRS